MAVTGDKQIGLDLGRPCHCHIHSDPVFSVHDAFVGNLLHALVLRNQFQPSISVLEADLKSGHFPFHTVEHLWLTLVRQEHAHVQQRYS